MGGFGCGIDDAELTSSVFDCLTRWPAQMPSEMSGLQGADCCPLLVMISVAYGVKGLDYDCKNHCISLDHGNKIVI